MPRKKGNTSEKEPGFEEAIAELEAIVGAMEEEQLPLEDLVAKYEQGTRLLARCETVLADARKRLLTIAESNAADDSAEDSLDPDGPISHDASASPDETDDDDDIRLF